MKTRLNLTIEDSVLKTMKSYAESRNVSISALVEDHFKTISNTPKHKNILDLLEELDIPPIDSDRDLKKEYYEERAKKYGF